MQNCFRGELQKKLEKGDIIKFLDSLGRAVGLDSTFYMHKEKKGLILERLIFSPSI